MRKLIGLLFASMVFVFLSVMAFAEPIATSVGALEGFLVMLPDWLKVGSLVVTAASSIAALTPTPKDDGVVRWLRKAIDFLALNFGNAKGVSAAPDPSYRY